MDRKELKHKIFWKYFFRKGRFINFKSPKLFTEKIQWLKVYDCNPIKTILADKIAVRNWVEEQIGKEYLKRIYGVYEKWEDIDFLKLPKEFVLKTNHGSKMQQIFLCHPIRKLKIKNKFEKYLNINYAFKSGYEMQYNDIKPVIFAEEYLQNTDELFEYLIFCFNGLPKLILFASGKNKEVPECTMFDTNWNNLHFNYGGKLHKEEIPCPENLDEMLEIARKLSKDFKFVRVDLHNINGKIYFGEMTFTPASGYMKFSKRKYDRILGDMLDLNK